MKSLEQYRRMRTLVDMPTRPCDPRDSGHETLKPLSACVDTRAISIVRALRLAAAARDVLERPSCSWYARRHVQRRRRQIGSRRCGPAADLMRARRHNEKRSRPELLKPKMVLTVRRHGA
jgi:hypothetical protein